MSKVLKAFKACLLGGATVLAMNMSAHAGGDIVAPVEEKAHACGLSANVAVATDYIFRGISQTQEDAAIQGGVDVSCGIFYAGLWGSNVDFNDDTTIEVDFYAGVKKDFKNVSVDVGVIYYTYDDAEDIVELKLAASTDVVGTSVGATGYFDFDNEIYTYEASAERGLSKIGAFTPTISGTVGVVTGDGADEYTFWNAGVSLGFAEKFALDLRYHDTDIDANDLADERFVATLSASF